MYRNSFNLSCFICTCHFSVWKSGTKGKTHYRMQMLEIPILLHLRDCHLLKHQVGFVGFFCSGMGGECVFGWLGFWCVFLWGFLYTNYYYLTKCRLGFLNKPSWYQVRHLAGREMQPWSFTSFCGTLHWVSLAAFPVHNAVSTAQQAAASLAEECEIHRDLPHRNTQTLLWVLPQVNG